MQEAACKINITLNGKGFSLSDGSTIEELLKELKITQKGIAVELNREIVPKGQYINALLKDGDIVEIVRMVGGG